MTKEEQRINDQAKQLMTSTYSSLEEWENGVAESYSDIPEPEDLFHITILGELPFRMLLNGWNKKDLLNFFESSVDDAILDIKKFDEEKLNGRG